MTIDTIAAAIDHIRSVTNSAWRAEDFEDSISNPVDASIAAILNAVVGGQLILAPPANAQAALDKLLAEARLEGWRAGRDAAANEAALYGCSEGADEYTEGIHVGYTDAVGQIVDGILALPEPKEASRAPH